MTFTTWPAVGGKQWFRHIQYLCAGLLIAVVLFGLGPMGNSARALDAFPVIGTQDRVELTQKGVALGGRGDRLQIDTAPGADGISRRMSVNATTPGTNPNWIVFALTNRTDKVIERWITIQRYSLIGSGVIWPDLDSRRMAALTPSVGFLPQRIDNDRADIFKIEIEPGQTVTYAAEMASARLSRIYMWKPLAYELHVRERRLFNGIMLGITGLLGIFLTAVFAANHKAIFPSAALVTWCVLIYLCVDFGFWHKLLQISSEDNAVYRAASEAAMATSIALFLHTFLRLGSWHGFARMLSSVWIVAQLALVFIAVLDPRLASTFARLSFAALGGMGALLILFLAVRGQDRALSIIPTWLLFIVWLFGIAMTLTGKLNGDIVVSSLVAGLVLITVLIGFTVTQFAFRSVEPHYGAAPSEQQLRSLAVEGAGAAVWEWHARRGEVKVGAIAEVALGLNLGELSTKVKDFVRYMHPADQERFNVLLWTVQNKGGGDIRADFRMRHADNSYRWFDLEAASVATSDRRSLRCVGLLRDVTDQKRSQARLMQDAVVDNLTGLPNRELLLDRLKTAVARVADEPELRPTLLYIDLDKFKGVNSSFGLIVGDSLLLTIARRLGRHLQPMDTLARLGDDRFAMLILSVSDPEELARLAESVRRALRAPIKIAGQDIVLTGTIGIAVHDPASSDGLDILKDAEIAMYRAKRNGADQIEIFRTDMRNERDDRAALEGDLRRALERRQVKVFYQPIIYLPTEELAGFEAQVRWEHPEHGLLNPQDYVSLAEDSDLIVKLGSYVLSEAVEKAVEWQKRLPRVKHPLFVSVNVANRQLFRQDLIQEIRHILSQEVVPNKVLRLEITESLVMENPERAAEILDLLEVTGAGLALDDFGTGYSSLAYLDRFPFDTIKLDRHLVQTSGDGQSSGSSIVRSIVAMAKELNKKVVAEGVETSQNVGFLRSIGCQYAQGYYYGEPMGERDVLDLLKIVRKSERKHQRRGIFGGGLGRKDEQIATPDQTPLAPDEQDVVAGATAQPSELPDPNGSQALPSHAQSRPAALPELPLAASAAQLTNSQGGRGAPLPVNGGSQAVPNSGFLQDAEVPPTAPRRMPPPHWRHAPQAGAPQAGAPQTGAPQADGAQGNVPPANDQVVQQGWQRGQAEMDAQGMGNQAVPSREMGAPGTVRIPPEIPLGAALQETGTGDSDGQPLPPSGQVPPIPASTNPEFLGDFPPADGVSSEIKTDSGRHAPDRSQAPPSLGAVGTSRDQAPPPMPTPIDGRTPLPVAQVELSPRQPDHDLGASKADEAEVLPTQPPVPPSEQLEAIDRNSDPTGQPTNESSAQPKRAGDFSTLPPGIAQSLARLAGVPATVKPANDKGREDDDQNNTSPPRKVEAGE